ncbi:NAD(P)/FAD-dependent oxidoreductase [Actinoplanes derwentensis]|uniref:3-phenylpropionate/trans-cinnamate dioxygenase ferredoxin reductase subunit n=1 Tax=Actinoplanes derwentensis TaxID=113562 RepID=A0A1H2DC33_9ACTN|nr:FAD-dependent oxidoreductase [Actinoplanes derwentensis]GID90195.1 ferredoxin reductase [Actinoplanes derwentensis]SDT80293.1 3-phenylpropionate/trans-cinnamate dioxygenase ferredoxin reductase subunit [Actinoplanes derwentensis]
MQNLGVVIVGAGHGGSAAAAELRSAGYPGPITVLGQEPHAPYHRPPLSKAWLAGTADANSLQLRPGRFYLEQGIDLRTGSTVVEIDRARSTVALADGREHVYDHLILATGSRPRRLPLPGADLDGVLALRDARDADRLKAALVPGSRAIVIGGGYLGLEVAAAASGLGVQVTVVEQQNRLLPRVAGDVLAGFLEGFHRSHGVEVLLSAAVTRLEGSSAGQVRCVHLSDGHVIDADTVLIAAGGVPNVELAEDAGLDCADGIVCDQSGRTSDPRIFAIGDCARRPVPHGGGLLRLESVHNANEQARRVAAVLCGLPLPPDEVPWFWSNQYDLKLQLAGLPYDVDEVVVRGDATKAPLAVFYLRHGVIQAVEAVNAPREFAVGRQLIGACRKVVPELLADPSVAMRDVSAAATEVAPAQK